MSQGGTKAQLELRVKEVKEKEERDTKMNFEEEMVTEKESEERKAKEALEEEMLTEEEGPPPPPSPSPLFLFSTLPMLDADNTTAQARFILRR